MSDKEQVKTPAPALIELGVSGVKRYGGYIYDEFLTTLQGKRGRKMYQEMMANEAVIGASMWVFESLLNQTAWHVTPTDASDPQSVEVADHVRTCLEEVEGGMAGYVSRALTAVGFGFAIMEKVYKIRRGPEYPAEFRSQYRDGRWGLRKLPLRKAASIERWIYESDETDRLLGVLQIPDSNARERYLPIDKVIHYRVKMDSDSPEGRSLLRCAYPSYYQAKHLRFVEAVGIERYMAGLPVIRVPLSIMTASPGTAEADARASYERLLTRIRKDEQSGILMPARVDGQGNESGYDIELLTGGGDKPADVDPVIKRYESRMGMTLLTEVMLLGSDSMGSYALSKDKTELLITGLATILGSMFDTLREQCLTELVELNGWPTELTPYLEHGPIKAPNLADLGAFIGSASSAGLLMPGEKSEEWAREQVGMPTEDRPSEAGFAGGDDLDRIDDIVDGASVDGAAPAIPVEGAEGIQESVMNGAQVQSLAAVVQQVAEGALPRDSGIGILMTGFRLTRQVATDVMGSAGLKPPAIGGTNER